MLIYECDKCKTKCYTNEDRIHTYKISLYHYNGNRHKDIMDVDFCDDCYKKLIKYIEKGVENE